MKALKARASEVADPLIDQGLATWEITKQRATPIIHETWERAKPTVERV